MTMKADELKTVIVMLKTLKTLSAKSGKNTAVLSVNIDSFNFVIDEAIKALEQQIKQEAYVAVEMPSDDELKHLEEQLKKAKLRFIPVEQESCEDCISRKSIKQKLQECHDLFIAAYGCFSNLPMLYKAKVDEITNCIAMVENEPSVTPQPKMEKWKIGQWKWEPYDRNSKFGDIKLGDWHCSECGSTVSECVYKDEKRGIPFYKYCPQCGAKMREVNADADSD